MGGHEGGGEVVGAPALGVPDVEQDGAVDADRVHRREQQLRVEVGDAPAPRMAVEVDHLRAVDHRVPPSSRRSRLPLHTARRVASSKPTLWM